MASGIYRSAEPPFDDAAPVWRYNLTALSGTEQKMFVWTRLTEIFEHARERGIVKGAAELRDVIVVDRSMKPTNSSPTKTLIFSTDFRKRLANSGWR